MRSFWLSFVPLFVAVDAIGLLPLFVNLTQEMQRWQIRKIVVQSMMTALVVAIAFILLGQGIFEFLNISVGDFMIAGGTLLFIISIRDILANERKSETVDPDSIGAVPIGVPLITGPAVLTTALILVNEHGSIITSLAIAANILIAGIVFLGGPVINKALGKTGAKTIHKITSLLLAAIGVMIVRRGIVAFLVETRKYI